MVAICIPNQLMIYMRHRSKLLELKEIADEQKVKISCLRRHRDEIKEDLVKLEDIHDAKIKEDDEIIGKLKKEVSQ